MTKTVIKAHGGDRASNLEGIADAVDRILSAFGTPNGAIIPPEEVDRITGYMDQLRIIAQEIRTTKTKNK